MPLTHIHFLNDELRNKEYLRAKSAGAVCKDCLYFLPSSKFSPYCSMKRKHVNALAFCNYFLKTDQNEPARNPSL